MRNQDELHLRNFLNGDSLMYNFNFNQISAVILFHRLVLHNQIAYGRLHPN